MPYHSAPNALVGVPPTRFYGRGFKRSESNYEGVDAGNDMFCFGNVGGKRFFVGGTPTKG